MARLAMVMRFIGRRRYQRVTVESLKRMAGGHTVHLYGLFSPTKRVGRAELFEDLVQVRMTLHGLTEIPEDFRGVNQSAWVAMLDLVHLAMKGEYDFYGYTEGDVLFNPDWLDKLLDLRQVALTEGMREHFGDGVEPRQHSRTLGIGCPIDMPMQWYEPEERETFWIKKWMAAQCYVMDRDTALHVKLDDPIYRTKQPPTGWDKEIGVGLSGQGYVHFTPKGISWAQHIGFHGVTSSDGWRPLGNGFFPAPEVKDLWELAHEVTREEVEAEYER